MARFSSLKLVVAVVVAFTLDAQAQAVLVPTVIYQQNFNAGLPGDMTAVNVGVNDAVTSSGGAVQVAQGFPNFDLGYLTNATFTGELFTVEADLNQLNGSQGNTVSGIVIGNRYISFFPGYTPTPGAFDIWGYDPVNGLVGTDFAIYANMGVVPAQGVYHHLKIDVNPFTNTFDIYVTNNGGLNFYYQFANNPGFVPGKIGFHNYSSEHITLYDNLTVTALREEVLPAPEPSTALLMGLGLVGLSVRRRKARRS